MREQFSCKNSNDDANLGTMSSLTNGTSISQMKGSVDFNVSNYNTVCHEESKQKGNNNGWQLQFAFKQRKQLIDASIVRVIKEKKEIKHAKLIDDVVKQLSNKFEKKIKDIKMRIEELIEMEY